MSAKDKSEFIGQFIKEVVRDNPLEGDEENPSSVLEAQEILKNMTDQFFSFDNQPKSEAIKQDLRLNRKANKHIKGLGSKLLRKHNVLKLTKNLEYLS